MTSVSTIDVYEMDGKDAPMVGPTVPKLVIKNHRIHRDRVVIVQTNGQEMTVLADELCKAIANAQNSHRY